MTDQIDNGHLTDCQVCGSSKCETVFAGEDARYRSDGPKFTVVRCADCGLRYVNPRPKASEIHHYYPPSYYSVTQPKRQTALGRFAKRLSRGVKRGILEEYYGYPTGRRSWFIRICRKWALFPFWALRCFQGRDLLPYVGRGKLLDVGCGGGVNLKTFQENGWDVWGVEMSPIAVARATEVVGDRIHLGTLDTAPFKPESFDAIVFSHSLEHMFKPAEVLLQTTRLLRPGGMVAVMVPNAGGLEARLFGRHWIGWDLPRHLFHFDRDTLCALLTNSGVEVVRVRTGKSSAIFMASLSVYFTGRFARALPAQKAIDRFVVRPLTLIAGHLGYGTEVTVYAVKKSSE